MKWSTKQRLGTGGGATRRLSGPGLCGQYSLAPTSRGVAPESSLGRADSCYFISARRCSGPSACSSWGFVSHFYVY